MKILSARWQYQYVLENFILKLWDDDFDVNENTLSAKWQFSYLMENSILKSYLKIIYEDLICAKKSIVQDDYSLMG